MCEVQDHDGQACGSTDVIDWCYTALKGYDNLKRTWVCRECYEGVVHRIHPDMELRGQSSVSKHTGPIACVACCVCHGC